MPPSASGSSKSAAVSRRRGSHAAPEPRSKAADWWVRRSISLPRQAGAARQIARRHLRSGARVAPRKSSPPGRRSAQPESADTDPAGRYRGRSRLRFMAACRRSRLCACARRIPSHPRKAWMSVHRGGARTTPHPRLLADVQLPESARRSDARRAQTSCWSCSTNMTSRSSRMMSARSSSGATALSPKASTAKAWFSTAAPSSKSLAPGYRVGWVAAGQPRRGPPTPQIDELAVNRCAWQDDRTLSA